MFDILSFFRSATATPLTFIDGQMLPNLPGTQRFSGISIQYVSNSPWKADVKIAQEGMGQTPIMLQYDLTDEFHTNLLNEANALSINIDKVNYIQVGQSAHIDGAKVICDCVSGMRHPWDQ